MANIKWTSFPLVGTAGATSTLVGLSAGANVRLSLSATPSASGVALWDANVNFSANNFIDGYASTATAVGLTTLTVASPYYQVFTGSTTQTVQLPVTSTLALGQSWLIVNKSSGNVTVTSSGGNIIQVVEANNSVLVVCISLAGTTAASWVSNYSISSGGVSSITGTANQVIASASTGNITLSLPQSIATTSSPTFNALSLTTNLIFDPAATRYIYLNTALSGNSSALALQAGALSASTGGSIVLRGAGDGTNTGGIDFSYGTTFPTTSTYFRFTASGFGAGTLLATIGASGSFFARDTSIMNSITANSAALTLNNNSSQANQVSYGLIANNLSSGTNATRYGVQTNVTANDAGVGSLFGFQSNVLTNRSGGGTITNFAGAWNAVTTGSGASTATNLAYYGSRNTVVSQYTGETANIYGCYGAATGASASAAVYALQGIASGVGTGTFGLYAQASGASTANYGVYATASGATTNWGVYSGAGTNYFSGNVSIGNTTPTNPLTVTGAGSFTTSVQATNLGVGTTPSGTTGRIVLDGSPGIYTATENSGIFYLNNGALSVGSGGSVLLYGSTHATKPCWVTIGIANAAAKFAINAQALGAGNDLFTVDAAQGNVSSLGSYTAGTSTGSATPTFKAFSPTGSSGSTSLTAANNAGNYANVLTNASTSAARTWTLPDASGTIALTSGASGIVNGGTANQLAYYATTGTAVSGLTSANNGLLVTSGTGVPSIGNAILADITINGVTAGLGNGSVATATAFGVSALPSNAAANNTAIGYHAQESVTTSSGNTACGAYALQYHTTREFNTAFGSEALRGAAGTNTSFANSAFGYQAIKAVTSGGNLCAFGSQSMFNTTSAQRCVAMGNVSMVNLVSGVSNTGVGTAAFSALLGSYNTGMGDNVGQSGATGGVDITTGSSNSLFGYNASGDNLATTGAIAIGANAVTTIATGVTSSDAGPGIAIGSASFPVGFRGDGTIYTGNMWRAKINGTQYMIPLLADGSTVIPASSGGTGITSLGAGVATWLGTPSSANLAAAVTDETGTGALVFGTSPTFTTQLTSPTVITTGAANTQKEFTANSGASITINPSDGAYQTITLTANTTITLGTVPSAATEREFILELRQDGTGGRTVTWSNITFATNSGANPAINTTAGGSTFIGVSGTSSAWVGYPVNQGVGVTDGSDAAAGYIGQVITSTLAIGSATALTTATDKTITSITLTAGDWMVSGNVGFIAAAGTLPTVLTASISATNNTQATSPNGGAFAQLGLAFTAASTNVLTLAATRVNITSTTTYYLVGTATFTVSTLTGYGSITARRFR